MNARRTALSKLESMVSRLRMNHFTLYDSDALTEAEADEAYMLVCGLWDSDFVRDAAAFTNALLLMVQPDARYYELAGICCLRLRHLLMAEAYFELSLRDEPHRALSLVGSGCALVSRGRVLEGNRRLRTGLTHAEADPVLRANADRMLRVAEQRRGAARGRRFDVTPVLPLELVQPAEPFECAS